MYECTQKIIKNKVGLLNLAEELGQVSKACKLMGFSRDTFYRYKSAVDEGGIEALFDKSRRLPNLKNRTDEATEQAVLDFAVEFPADGQLRVSNEFGGVYQQTFVDTYCKIAQCKLYTTKTPITWADLLNDRVLPFFEEHDMGILRILTHCGT